MSVERKDYPERVWLERDEETNEKRWFTVPGMGVEYVLATRPEREAQEAVAWLWTSKGDSKPFRRLSRTIMWPQGDVVEVQPLVPAAALAEKDAEIERLTRERDEARALCDRLRGEARIHSGEARAHKASLHEAYQACSGATGERGDWHGARPVKETVEDLRSRAERLETELAALAEEKQDG